MDEEQGFGIPKTSLRAQEFELSKREAKANEDAMAYLRRALDTTPEVTPQQGIASALLAAVPTIGGYLIGNAVGRPKTPEGFYFDNQKDMALMSNDAGVQGATAGGSLADAYLSEIAKRQELQRAQYKDMAALKAREAADIRGMQSNAQSIRMQADIQKEMIPLKEASSIRIAQAQQGPREPTMWDMMSPAQKQARLAQISGVDAQGNPTQEAPHLRPLDAETQKSITNTLTNIDIGKELADDLEKVPNIGSYLKIKAASGLDPELIQSRMQMIVSGAINEISGTAASVPERENLTRMIQGDNTADPKMAARTLRNYLEIQRRKALNRLEVAGKSATPEMLKQQFLQPIVPAPTQSDSPPPGMNQEQFSQWYRSRRGIQ